MNLILKNSKGMGSEKSSFESVNLVVDYIGLTIQGLIDVEELGEYLFKGFGFNSRIKKSQNNGFETFFYKSGNKFEVSFFVCHYEEFYWTGIKVDFSGKNGAHFYNLIKSGKIDWYLFDLNRTKLSRFDIHYLRIGSGIYEGVSVYEFLKKCEEKIIQHSRIKNVSLDNSEGSCILRIGSRKSPRFYRIYEKKRGLEFEIELKKKAIAYLGDYLFSNQLVYLEGILSKEFYKRSSSLLVLNTPYTDWLLVGYRKMCRLNAYPLVTSYMERSLGCEKEYLMKLIQFLSFLKNLKGYRKLFFDEAYYLIEFDVFEFLNFLKVVGVSKGKRQNRLIQTLDFLKSLQKLDPMITNFSETFFRSCVIFPYLSVEKKGKFWSVKIAILESLYKYSYPFSFPHNLLLYQNVYELEVKFELIQSMSQISLKKTFLTRDILERCSISNKNKAKVKKLILDSFSILLKEKIISPDFGLINKKGAFSSVRFTELTPLLIGKSNKIIFYENVVTRT